MTFDAWMEKKIDEMTEKNPELKRVFEEYPERRELYKQKLLDSESSIDGGFRMRYQEEVKEK